MQRILSARRRRDTRGAQGGETSRTCWIACRFGVGRSVVGAPSCRVDSFRSEPRAWADLTPHIFAQPSAARTLDPRVVRLVAN
jgi:hypothetical protein